MNTFKRLLENQDKFISDLGDSHDVTDAKTGRVHMKLPRYGVWAYDANRGKHQVIDTHDDLDVLKKRHGISDDRLVKMFKEASENEKEIFRKAQESVPYVPFEKINQGVLAADDARDAGQHGAALSNHYDNLIPAIKHHFEMHPDDSFKHIMRDDPELQIQDPHLVAAARAGFSFARSKDKKSLHQATHHIADYWDEVSKSYANRAAQLRKSAK